MKYCFISMSIPHVTSTLLSTHTMRYDLSMIKKCSHNDHKTIHRVFFVYDPFSTTSCGC